MNMIIQDMEGAIEIGDIFKASKFHSRPGKLRAYNRLNQTFVQSSFRLKQ